MLKLLTLGGNSFLGRAVAREAVRRGHAVTTFTRGRTGVAPEGAVGVRGSRDRPGELADALQELAIDAVVDTSCLKPGWVGAALDQLPDLHSYVLISTLCVYRDYPRRPITDESAPVHPPDADCYGGMKVGEERVLHERLGDRGLSVRAGVLVGPEDVLGTLPWWLWRMRVGGPVPVPVDLDVPIAVLDVRDLASWIVTAVERGIGGVVNATGFPGEWTLGDLLDRCADAVAADAVTPARFVAVEDAALTAVGATLENFRMPFWGPGEVGRTVWRVGNARARATGLRCRPLGDTVNDTWAWLRGLPSPPLKPGILAPGLSPAAEATLLATAGATQ